VLLRRRTDRGSDVRAAAEVGVAAGGL